MSENSDNSLPGETIHPRRVRRLLIPTAVLGLAAVSVAGVYGCRTLATIDYGPETASLGDLRSPQAEPTGSEPPTVVDPVAYLARDSGILVGPLDEMGTLDSGIFWPASERTDTFLVGDAERDGPVRVVRTIRLLDDGTVEVARAPEDPEAAPDFGATTTLAREDSGDVVVRFNAASKIESTFDPAALFLPATLQAGETVERAFTVDAVGPRFGTGTGEFSIMFSGHGIQSVLTKSCDIVAFVFSSESSFQIGPATITRTRRAWVVVDAGEEPAQGSLADLPGIVAEESGQTVKVFGISFSSKAWVSVRTNDVVSQP